MEILETADFELLMTLVPYLQETELTSLQDFKVNTPTLHLTHGAAAKFGMYVAEDDFNGRYPIVGIPNFVCSSDSRRTLFDVLMRCKITKCYVVPKEAALFIVIKSIAAENETVSYYAIRIPCSPAKVNVAAISKKVMLCRMDNYEYQPNTGTLTNVMLEVVKLNSREWEAA